MVQMRTRQGSKADGLKMPAIKAQQRVKPTIAAELRAEPYLMLKLELFAETGLMAVTGLALSLCDCATTLVRSLTLDRLLIAIVQLS